MGPHPAVDVDEEERVTGKDVVRCVLVAIRPNAAAAEPAASDQPGTGGAISQTNHITRKRG